MNIEASQVPSGLGKDTPGQNGLNQEGGGGARYGAGSGQGHCEEGQ